MAEVSLADAITNLRSELEKAIAVGDGEELQFALETVELELNVSFTTSGHADAKVGLWTVITTGVSADHSRGSTHRLTLTLSPRLASAPRQKVSVGDQVAALPPAVNRGG